MRPLLVGEDNPYGNDPRFALYPDPVTSAGGRLCFLIMQMKLKQYIGAFDRVNLCSTRWTMREARARVRELRADSTPRRAIVLLGSKVCSAFDVEFKPFTVEGSGLGYPRVILPHPSGRNFIWNDPKSLPRAREALREAGVL